MRKVPIERLRFENASFGYSADRPIFKNISFDLPTDRNVLVTGPAGNGQSTFLKLLAVMRQPQSGAFLINGANTTEMSFEEFLPIRMRIGYTFDYGGLFANRSLLDNMTLPLLYHKIYDYDEAKDLARSFASKLTFTNQLEARPAEVSGGLRKMVTIIRMLLMKPEMVVMDDPFTGVDSDSVKKLIQIIQDRRSSGEIRHLFFTSRDEVWPERLGYEPLVIDRGFLHFGGQAHAGAANCDEPEEAAS